MKIHGDLRIGKTYFQSLFRTFRTWPKEMSGLFPGIDLMRHITEIRGEDSVCIFQFDGRFPVITASGSAPLQRCGMKAARWIILTIQQCTAPADTAGDIPVLRILLTEYRPVIIMLQMSGFRNFKKIRSGLRLNLKP